MSLCADIVVGLSFGDEGKGATVDALVAKSGAKAVVRFNGGQQAEHNVIVNGKHHTFSSYGSGSFSGADTYISEFCTINPVAIWNEGQALYGVIGGIPEMYIHERALVTLPCHVESNIANEKRNGHGTTGTGFGETVRIGIHHPDIALRAGDLRDHQKATDKMRAIYGLLFDEGQIERLPGSDDIERIVHAMVGILFSQTTCVLDHQVWYGLLGRNDHIVFEGAQGFLLDETYGTWPNVTWSTTSPKNALTICHRLGIDRKDVRVVGCLRSYASRHGAGILPHEGDIPRVPEMHNKDTGIQGAFRSAPHDVDMLNYAINHCEPDVLAISHCDVYDGILSDGGLEDIEEFGPVLIKATGPAREDRTFLEV